MVDPEHVFRRALSWLPSNFVSVDEAALQTPRQFSSVDHLSAEAVAAYVDGELPMKAHLRASGHLSACGQCRAEVDAQGQARAALRDCRPVTMPSTLMGLLSQIPQSTTHEPPHEPPHEPTNSPTPNGPPSLPAADDGHGVGMTRGWRKRR
jgi:anti-sigma factor ChrR (cupin superfamily)